MLYANFGIENLYTIYLKTITASSLKLSKLIEEKEQINWSKFRKKKYFFSNCPFLVIALCKFGHLKLAFKISKIIIASSFNYGQLVEDDE